MIINSSIANLRQNYTLAGLEVTDVSSNPMQQFEIWFQEALDAEIPEPNAMTLATASLDGKPSARIVLLKGVSDRGFVFYTNYQSQKGKQLAANPHVALVFLWDKLERQVRVEGTVEKLTAKESDDYFHSRPRASQLGALASAQSQTVPNRKVLDDSLEALSAQYTDDREIPRPAHWGGYRVIPSQIEFWQGRPNRLHDRLLYSRQANDGWQIERLSP